MHIRSPPIPKLATCPALNNGQSHASPLWANYRPLYVIGLKVYKQNNALFVKLILTTYKPPPAAAFQML